MFGIHRRKTSRVALHRVLVHFVELSIQAIDLLIKAPIDVELAVQPFPRTGANHLCFVMVLKGALGLARGYTITTHQLLNTF